MATLQTLGVWILVIIFGLALVFTVIMVTSRFGIKFTEALKQLQRGIIITLGYLVFIFVWALGFVTLLNNQDFSKEFRFFLDRAGEGEDLLVKSMPGPEFKKRK